VAGGSKLSVWQGFVADVTCFLRSAFATAALVLALAPAAHGAFPGRNGFVAFVHTSYVSEGEDGEGPGTSTRSIMARRLFGFERFTLLDGAYDSPAYSPDGSSLLVDAGDRLALMRSDGSDFRLLPRQTADDGAPAWAPDGRRFVFTGVPDGGTAPDLYVFNLARNRSRRLTTTGGSAPAWSVRNRIVYVAAGRLALVDPDGSHRRRLTHKEGLAPNWSPHGTKIVFVRKGRIYMIGANGKGLWRVGGPRFSFEATDVTWSPDGRYLAYHDFEDGITVLDARGRRDYEFELGQYSSDGSFDSFSPDWQPLPRPRR
jgi:TolB protein